MTRQYPFDRDPLLFRESAPVSNNAGQSTNTPTIDPAAELPANPYLPYSKGISELLTTPCNPTTTLPNYVSNYENYFTQMQHLGGGVPILAGNKVSPQALCQMLERVKKAFVQFKSRSVANEVWNKLVNARVHLVIADRSLASINDLPEVRRRNAELPDPAGVFFRGNARWVPLLVVQEQLDEGWEEFATMHEIGHAISQLGAVPGQTWDQPTEEKWADAVAKAITRPGDLSEVDSSMRQNIALYFHTSTQTVPAPTQPPSQPPASNGTSTPPSTNPNPTPSSSRVEMEHGLVYGSGIVQSSESGVTFKTFTTNVVPGSMLAVPIPSSKLLGSGYYAITIR